MITSLGLASDGLLERGGAAARHIAVRGFLREAVGETAAPHNIIDAGEIARVTQADGFGFVVAPGFGVAQVGIDRNAEGFADRLICGAGASPVEVATQRTTRPNLGRVIKVSK